MYHIAPDSELSLNANHCFLFLTGMRDDGGDSERQGPDDHRPFYRVHSPLPSLWRVSQRIYRYDTRRPRDLPRWEYAVCLVLHVRRFRCVNATCMTQTLTECLPQTVRPVAQHTVCLTTVLQQLGLALGGERRVT